MKRFFQPVEKDGSFKKKPTLTSSSTSVIEDGEETTTTTSPVDEKKKKKKEPLKFITWNANSFLLRVKNNWPEFTNFIHNLDPDVIAIQVILTPHPSSSFLSLPLYFNFDY